MSFLYILEISVLWITSFAIIFSHTLLFYLLFVVQKAVNLIRPFFFFLLPWEPDIRKQWENFLQSMFSLHFSLGVCGVISPI